MLEVVDSRSNTSTGAVVDLRPFRRPTFIARKKMNTWGMLASIDGAEEDGAITCVWLKMGNVWKVA